MSDEESFIILGTSPTPSMNTMNSLPTASNPATMTKTMTNGPLNEILLPNEIPDHELTTSSSSKGSHLSNVDNEMANGTQEVNGPLQADCVSTSAGELTSSVHGNADSRQLPEISGKTIPRKTDSIAPTSNVIQNPEATLAASFILEEVNSDVLKSTVYSEFPSISSMGASTEDVIKLQNIMDEYMELKKTLINTNATMAQFYDQTQKWKADVKDMEDERTTENAKLRNENLELRRDLDIKVEQININEEARCKEHEEFIRSLSEKSSQIENMSTQIQKLDQQQNVTTMEHQRFIKDFEGQMSAIVAENLELKDMQQNFIDEIKYLKVKLTIAEVEKSEMLNKFDNKCKSLSVDIDVLTQKLNCRDLKIEQEQQKKLAKKNKLLSNLRDLQRKIQEAQKNSEVHTKQSMFTTTAVPNTRPQPSTIRVSAGVRKSVYFFDDKA